MKNDCFEVIQSAFIVKLQIRYFCVKNELNIHKNNYCIYKILVSEACIYGYL